MTKKIEDYGKNNSNQRLIIDNLTKKLEEFSKGKSGEEEGILYKDIKRAKDLTKEEQDEMSATELKQFDEIATLKEGLNNLAKMMQSKETPKEEKTEAPVDDGDLNLNKIDDFKKEAKDIAKEIAGNDIDMANKILKEFNEFAGNDKLDRTQLKERMIKASKLVPEFKPVKEQPTKKGSPVAGGEAQADPFGIDAIVEGASKGSDGSYAL